MPDGRTHDEITLISASFLAPISAGLIFGGQVGRTVVFLISYLVSGLLFSDDLDTHSIEYKRWKLLRILWLPYQKLVPHRSWVSHSLIVGPALRIIYFASILTLVLWLALAGLEQLLPLNAGGLLGDTLAAIGRWILLHPHVTAIAFAGFALGSAAHSISDWIWTWLRRTFRIPTVAEAPPGVSAPTHHGEPMSGFAVHYSENVAEPEIR